MILGEQHVRSTEPTGRVQVNARCGRRAPSAPTSGSAAHNGRRWPTRNRRARPRGVCADLRTRSSVQQQSTATTAPSDTFGFIQMRPGQREQGYKWLLRGVRDEEVAGSNPVTPTSVRPCQSQFCKIKSGPCPNRALIRRGPSVDAVPPTLGPLSVSRSSSTQ